MANVSEPTERGDNPWGQGECCEVVLVQPNVVWVYDPFEHLGLAYLAASLRRAGFRVTIIDAVLDRLTLAQLFEAVRALAPKVVGVTVISHGYRQTVRFLERMRLALPEAKMLGGGHFATFAAAKIMADTKVFDAIALGEADENLVDYCRRYVRGEEVEVGGFMFPDGPSRHPGRRVDVAALPFPARDYLALAMTRGARASITSSRGCYARCAFCTVHSFYQRVDGRRWFGRPIDDIIAELRLLHDEHGIDHFNFVDDNFVGAGPAGRQRVLDFAERYRRSGLPMTFHIDCRASDVSEEIVAALAEAGMVSTFLGIESVSRQDLIDYRKGLKVEANWRAVEILRRYGIAFTLAMIMFNPRTKREAIIDNVNYLKSVRYYPRNPVSMLNIYEGTDLATIYKEFVSGPFWDYRFRFEHEETAAIHQAALTFCKDTLPFERILALGSGDAQDWRVELNRIRVYALGDLAERWGEADAQEILVPWREAVARLRRSSRVEAAGSVEAARFGRERLYLQAAEPASLGAP